MTGHLSQACLGLLQALVGSVAPRADLYLGLAQVQKPWPGDAISQNRVESRESYQSTLSPFPFVLILISW
jgi:hypothetical protein